MKLRPPFAKAVVGSLLAISAFAAQAEPTSMTPVFTMEVANPTKLWRATLSANGSTTESRLAGDSAWTLESSDSIAYFTPGGDGSWTMSQDWDWNRAAFTFHIDSGATVGNLDPFLAYGFVATNLTGGLLSFEHAVTAPVVPTVSGPNLVRASVVAGVTDATGNGVTLAPTPTHTQDSDGNPELQLFLLGSSNNFTSGYANAGVDVGTVLAQPASGVGTSYAYGPFAAGPVAGPTGSWNFMQLRTAFSLTGNNDIAVVTGFAEITPIPEPEAYALMLAGLGLVAFAARRRRAA
jgi:hypothetical protein